MTGMTEKLKKHAHDLGVTAIGTAPVERYYLTPLGHRPGDFLPVAKRVVTFAYKLNNGSLNNLPVTRNQYMVEI